MNGYEAMEEQLEAFDESDDGEFEEDLAALLEDDGESRRRRRPVRTGRGAGYYRPRPQSTNVTQTQLQSAMARISNDVKANAAGIKTVGARVDAVNAAQRRQAAVLKKESVERKAEIAKLKNSLQMATLLPLVMNKSVTLPAGTVLGDSEVRLDKETKLMVAPDTMAALLPMMLMGDGFGGGGTGGGGDSTSMMFMALALTGGLSGKS